MCLMNRELVCKCEWSKSKSWVWIMITFMNKIYTNIKWHILGFLEPDKMCLCETMTWKTNIYKSTTHSSVRPLHLDDISQEFQLWGQFWITNIIQGFCPQTPTSPFHSHSVIKSADQAQTPPLTPLLSLKCKLALSVLCSILLGLGLMSFSCIDNQKIFQMIIDIYQNFQIEINRHK